METEKKGNGGPDREMQRLQQRAADLQEEIRRLAAFDLTDRMTEGAGQLQEMKLRFQNNAFGAARDKLQAWLADADDLLDRMEQKPEAGAQQPEHPETEATEAEHRKTEAPEAEHPEAGALEPEYRKAEGPEAEHRTAGAPEAKNPETGLRQMRERDEDLLRDHRCGQLRISKEIMQQLLTYTLAEMELREQLISDLSGLSRAETDLHLTEQISKLAAFREAVRRSKEDEKE